MCRAERQSKSKRAVSAKTLKQARHITVNADDHGRRLDNWLFSCCKNVPKSRVYRSIRRGEVRVDSRRAKAADKLIAGQDIRVPPWRHNKAATHSPPLRQETIEQLQQSILYEDEHVLVVDKPAGLSVHAGRRRRFGLSEGLLRLRAGHDEYLRPAHRLDRETSGCLVFARNKPALLALHEAFRQRRVQKRYLALLTHSWSKDLRRVELPLSIVRQADGAKVFVAKDGEGKTSLSLFKLVKQFADCTLVQIKPLSGRMHQIRVHAAHHRRPLVGDHLYSNTEQFAAVRHLQAPRLCLHASCISFALHGRTYCFVALLPEDLSKVIERAML